MAKITAECKKGQHRACPLEIPPKDYGQHAIPCECDCHYAFERFNQPLPERRRKRRKR